MNPDNTEPRAANPSADRPTRPEALKQAEELVNRLSPVNNQRGYPDGAAGKLSERVSAILQVADWLCAGASA